MTMAQSSHEVKSYLGKRPSIALNVPLAQTWCGTQLGGAPHSYLPSPQMMMSSPQQLPFAGPHQACVNPTGQFLQCWTPYMPMSQMVPVSSWAAGVGPAENSANAASYLQGQRPHMPVVLPAMVMVFIPQQPPQHPAPQSEGLRQRERKLIRIRDPNQDGRDVTEEIMSSLSSTSTARGRPQSSKVLGHSSQCHTEGPRPKKAKSRIAAEASLHPVTASKQPLVEAKQDLQNPTTLRARWGAAAGAAGVQYQPTWDERSSSLPTSTAPSPKTPSKLPAKAVVALDAPVKTQEAESALPERAPRVRGKKMHQTRNLEKGKLAAQPKPEPALEVAALVVNVVSSELEVFQSPPSQSEPAKLDSQSSSPCSAEPPLSNGLPPDTRELSNDVPLSDGTAPDWPGASCSPEPSAVDAEVAAQEETEQPLEGQPAKRTAEAGDDSQGDRDEKDCIKHEWTEVAPGCYEPTEPGERRRYDREFLLALQFVGASMQKTQGLPLINGIILDKVNETPLPPADPARLMLFLGSLKSKSANGPRCTAGLRRSQQVQKKEPRKANSSSSLNEEVQLNKAENAWKPSLRKPARCHPGEEDAEDEDLQQIKTRRLFKRLRTILNRLTPDNFQQLMKQVHELTIDTEQRLRGAINLIFEKAISEPNLSEAHANMCRFLTGLKVPASDKPDVSVNFRSLLLERCQKEFEKEQSDCEALERKRNELESAEDDAERECRRAELEVARGKARRRSLGSTKFIGELFKLKMLTVPIMDNCVMKLLKDQDEESLDCLCWLFLKIGKNLDFKKAKPRMDQYLEQIDNIIKDENTSSTMCLKLEAILDLRKNNWELQNEDRAAQTKDQSPKDTSATEKKKDLTEVPQQSPSKKDTGGRTGVSVDSCVQPGGSGTTQSQDETWNAAALSKKRTADSTRLRKITKPNDLETVEQQVAAGGKKDKWSSWGSVVSQGWGGQANSSFNHLSGLQRGGLFSSAPLLHQVPQSFRSASSCERGDDGDWRCRDMEQFELFNRREGHENQTQASETSCVQESRGSDVKDQDKQNSSVPGPPAPGAPEEEDMGGRDIGSGDRGSIQDLKAKLNRALTIHSLAKPVIKKEEVERRSSTITDDYRHINNLKQNMKFCVGGDMEPKEVGRKVFTEEELTRELHRLLQEQANNQQIKDWVEENLDEVQTASNHFVRALMTSVCQSAIICDKLYRVDAQQITQRASLLQVYLCDEQKELQALYALQALMVDMEQSANLQRMFFDALCDQDVIMEEAFSKWESSVHST